MNVKLLVGLLVAAMAVGARGADPATRGGNRAQSPPPPAASLHSHAPAEETPFTPGGKYRQHDMQRPRPAVVDPGTAGSDDRPERPPSDAIVLFDGKDLSHWKGIRHANGKREIGPPQWKVCNGYMEVETTTRTGDIYTKEKFGDCQIHVEWATPAEVQGTGQQRGNSGILLSGHAELQILDSYDNDTYPDGQAAALYHKYPPLVNACRRPGQWQVFDMIFEAPRFDAQNRPTRPARITVFHNGILVHHAVETGGRLREIEIGLQDHLCPVRFRNIWVRPLRGYDELPGEMVPGGSLQEKDHEDTTARKG